MIPNSTEERQDIIQAVSLGTPEGLIAFCKGIQAAAPVDSYVDPEPWDMPGYDSQVIMAYSAHINFFHIIGNLCAGFHVTFIPIGCGSARSRRIRYTTI